SRFRADLEAAASGARPWYEVLATPGLVFKRNDPRVDPGGYRGVFVFALAERFYGLPGLKDRLLQGDGNEAELLDGSFQALQDGTIDALVTYVTIPLALGLPYIQLPDEVDQSNLGMIPLYHTVSYTNPRGQTFTGTAAVYGATILQAAA